MRLIDRTPTNVTGNGMLKRFFPDTGHIASGFRFVAKLPKLLERVSKTEIGVHQTSERNAFDATWYISRYADVANARVNPLQHYLLYGRVEGRFANAYAETLSLFNGQFDRDWYASTYPEVAGAGVDLWTHFISHGAREGRFPNQGEAIKAKAAASFDGAWYKGRNPDVAESGIDPLTHFLQQGFLEDRRPNATTLLLNSPVTDARVQILKMLPRFSEVCLFVTHCPDRVIKPHVELYLRELKLNGISIVLIIAADNFAVETHTLIDIVDGLVVRENDGFDFAAWAHILRLMPKLWEVDVLYLANDSVVGPICSRQFSMMLEKIRHSSADVIGISENIDRGWHLQSYFLAFKRDALSSSALRIFFSEVVSFVRKNDVVNEYETRLSYILRDAGLSCSALFHKPGASDPTLYYWQEMLDAGLPFIKISTIRHDIKGEKASNWRSVLSKRDFDVVIADQILEYLR